MTAFKLAVGYATQSIGVLSEGIHSFLDLVSAALAYYAVREAGKPADPEHPFGHGKFETISSLFESLLLAAAAVFIVFEAYDHLLHPHPIQNPGLAILTIVISLIVSYAMFVHNRGAAEATESNAIGVNALHFLSDAVASGGVLAGLVLLHFTGWLIIDPIIALAIAAYILSIAARQVRAALLELTDTQLPDSEVREIRSIVSSFPDRTIEAHEIRTRRSGAQRHIDFHLVVCGEMTVHESHAVCDEMEQRLYSRFPNASVSIHVEPCDHENVICRRDCPYRARKGSRA